MPYDRFHPFYATLVKRCCLNRPGSSKETLHLSLDIQGSGISYKPGDAVAIIPQNDPKLVDKTLQFMQASGREPYQDAKSGAITTLRHALLHKLNISRVTKPLLTYILDQTAPNPELAQALSGHQSWSHYASQFEVWDLLEQHRLSAPDPLQLAALLSPLLPRFYSIASSQDMVGDCIELTVAVVEYITRGYRRMGTASQFLGHLAPLNEPVVPLYLQPSHSFSLPEESASLIMVGPGTGVAPFRAFMQHRLVKRASGKNWLFFGECQREYDFLYESFWCDMHKKGMLELDLAFSRDEEEKVYVQHRMLEKAEKLWQWLEQGAYFYVCGDAHHMAKDVDAALHKIIQMQGQISDEGARHYVKQMKIDKRYLRDVY